MERSAILSRRSTPEEVGGFDLSPVQSEEAAHVLAVDDSIVDRKVIERLLKFFSCKVTAVDSGRRALQLLGLDEERTSAGFDGLKVDLIITDYCMPGMNGYELLKKIKESSTFRQTPVVIMSSEHILARIERCLEEGAEDFIVKPVKLSDVKRLRDYMTREDRDGNESRGINKRKLGDACDVSPSLSSPPPPPPPPPPSISSSPPSNSSSPPSNSSSPPSISSSPPSNSSSPPSISSSPSSRSAPSSPTSLDSPTRRLKAASCD